MLKLSTHLTIETIKKSKKLSNFNTELCWNEDLSTKFPVKRKEYSKDHWIKAKNYGHFSIADIIDNAESLFGNKKIPQDNTWRFNATDILVMCWDNKPLSEIEEYILNNIKE